MQTRPTSAATSVSKARRKLIYAQNRQGSGLFIDKILKAGESGAINDGLKLAKHHRTKSAVTTIEKAQEMLGKNLNRDGSAQSYVSTRREPMIVRNKDSHG